MCVRVCVCACVRVCVCVLYTCAYKRVHVGVSAAAFYTLRFCQVCMGLTRFFGDIEYDVHGSRGVAEGVVHKTDDVIAYLRIAGVRLSAC